MSPAFCPPLDAFKDLHILLKLWCPDLHTVFKSRPHQHWIQQDHHLFCQLIMLCLMHPRMGFAVMSCGTCGISLEGVWWMRMDVQESRSCAAGCLQAQLSTSLPSHSYVFHWVVFSLQSVTPRKSVDFRKTKPIARRLTFTVWRVYISWGFARCPQDEKGWKPPV